MHGAVHPTGEPGENGEGSGTTLGMAKKCLTLVRSGAQGVPRQAARSGSSTGQEACGGSEPACWGRAAGGGPVGGSPPTTGGFGARERHLRVTGAGSGSGSADPVPTPSGSGTGDGDPSRYPAPGPSGHGVGIRQPPVCRRRGPRATAVGGRRSEVQEDRPRVVHRQLARSAPRSGRGKPRRLLGATTVFRPGRRTRRTCDPVARVAQLRRARADRCRVPACSLQAREEPRPCHRPSEPAPGTAPPRWRPR